MRRNVLMLPVVVTLAGGAVGCGSVPETEAQATEPVFEAQTIDDSVGVGYGLAIEDMDGDGSPDVLMADESQIVWYPNGGWDRRVIAENLTERDNVAITARDLDGDNRVEIAVGAQWRPGETSDTAASGAIRYLVRPAGEGQPWQPVALPHDPTTHRMRWVSLGNGRYSLVVAPLHGIGNAQNEGAGSRITAYIPPADPSQPWETVVLDSTMNATHNFDVVPLEGSDAEQILIGGKQGLVRVAPQNGQWVAHSGEVIPGIGTTSGIGEVRQGRLSDDVHFIATIEALHGNEVVVYVNENGQYRRQVLDDGFAEGHGLATADILGLGRDQIVAGWRNPDAAGKVGIKLFVPDATGTTWTEHLIDDNTMAVEDLKTADLDGDGAPEIIAAGRATNNLIIYWNRSQQ